MARKVAKESQWIDALALEFLGVNDTITVGELRCELEERDGPPTWKKKNPKQRRNACMTAIKRLERNELIIEVSGKKGRGNRRKYRLSYPIPMETDFAAELRQRGLQLDVRACLIAILPCIWSDAAMPFALKNAVVKVSEFCSVGDPEGTPLTSREVAALVSDLPIHVGQSSTELHGLRGTGYWTRATTEERLEALDRLSRKNEAP